MSCYDAFVVRKGLDKTFNSQIEQLSIADLPNEDLLIRVRYSSINFKDCMSIRGNPAITLSLIHI